MVITDKQEKNLSYTLNALLDAQQSIELKKGRIENAEEDLEDQKKKVEDYEETLSNNMKSILENHTLRKVVVRLYDTFYLVEMRGVRSNGSEYVHFEEVSFVDYKEKEIEND